MANKEINFWRMTISLAIVTLVSSATLGFVYEITKGPIAEAKLAKQIKAISQVVPQYDNKPVDEMYKIPVSDHPGDSLEVFPAKEGGKQIGLAVKSYSTKAYGGYLWVMVGMDMEGHIIDTYVLEHKETPGLGSKMTEPDFKDQFKNKNPKEFTLKVAKDGGDIDALTGATISSRAYADALQRAFDSVKQYENESAK